MSRILSDHVFSSESVSEGHPDKLCDQISDEVLDCCLRLDARSRVACNTMVAYDLLVTVGEITCSGWSQIDTEAIARRTVDEVGYDREELGFWSKSFDYISRIHEQSADIAQGIDDGDSDPLDQGAGDQGMMFGYASDETPELMPAPIAFSHRILRRLAELRKTGSIAYLRPDGKAQVSVMYHKGKPAHIDTVVISHQTDDVEIGRIRPDLEETARDLLKPTGLLRNETVFHINPTGRFVLGGPTADSGLTGRKIIVDTYGGGAGHGGGAFSGKDPSKVDRSAAYYARYVAKNIVAAGLAEKCEIQIAYAIGIARPVSINIQTFGTGKVDEAKLQSIVGSSEHFDFRPASIINHFSLLRPQGWSYRETAAYGHFGRDQFPWEKTDLTDVLKQASGIK
ncbi:MAG: methionine adenosyltransferase [Pseudomonadota bacterium]